MSDTKERDKAVSHSIAHQQRAEREWISWLVTTAAIDPAAGRAAALDILPDSLTLPLHRTILDAALWCVERGVAPDRYGVIDRLRASHALDWGAVLAVLDSADPLAFAACAEVAPGAARRWEEPATRLARWLEAEHRNRLQASELAAAQTAASEGRQDDMLEHLDLAKEAQRVVSEAIPSAADIVRNFAVDVAGRMNGDRAGGIATGHDALDSLIGLTEPGSLTIIGARPNVGKSTLGLALGDGWAKAGYPVGIIHLEDGDAVNGARIAALAAGASASGLTGAREYLRREDVTRVFAVANEPPPHLSRLFVKHLAGRDSVSVRQTMRIMVRSLGCRVVMIDYMQALEIQPRKNELEAKAIGRALRALKDMAEDLQIPLIVMSQLTRASAEGRPRMQDLRDSGALEEGAERVLMLWTEGGARVLGVAKRKQGGPTQECLRIVTDPHTWGVVAYEPHTPAETPSTPPQRQSKWQRHGQPIKPHDPRDFQD